MEWVSAFPWTDCPVSSGLGVRIQWNTHNMARMKRVVVPGYPHHIVQRGVRSLDIFYKEQDRVEYLSLLQRQGDRFGVKFLTYCLMTNHVHLLAIPKQADSLARALGEVHRLYPRMIN